MDMGIKTLPDLGQGGKMLSEINLSDRLLETEDIATVDDLGVIDLGMGFVVVEFDVLDMVDLNGEHTFGGTLDDDGTAMMGVEDIVDLHLPLGDVLLKPFEFKFMGGMEFTDDGAVLQGVEAIFHADGQNGTDERLGIIAITVIHIEPGFETEQNGFAILRDLDSIDGRILNKESDGQPPGPNSGKRNNHNLPPSA